MPTFEARTSAQPGRCVVALAGECDLAVRDELTSALLRAVETAPVVEVDLDELRFIDSTGVHALVTAYHAAQRGGTSVYVANARGVVAQVLEVTGVGALLQAPVTGGSDGAARS